MTEPHATTRTTADGRVVRAVIWLPGLAVALGAAAATAHGLFEVALAARVPAGIAWLYPLITDGLALVAYAATARLRGGAARYAWAVVVLAAGLSGLAQAAYLAGDAAVDAPPALRFGVGAWPAIAAAVVAHLLYLLAAADGPGAAPDDPKTRPVLVATGGADDAGGTEPYDHSRPFPPPATAGSAAPGVHPRPYTPAVVQPRPPDQPDTAPAVPEPGPVVEHPDRPVEHRPYSSLGQHPGSVEHAVAGAAQPLPRDRARAVAVRHAGRHGALPTVSELVAAAEVSRGTAAAALKALREQPTPLHLVSKVPDARETPDRRTQP